MASSSAANSDQNLVRGIRLGGATMLVMGNVLGSAIFLTTGIMARELPNVSMLLIAWGLGGLLALAGGLTCAELGAMYPHSGGWFVFLSEAYGPLWGFMFGWAGMLVMLTGSLAAVAVGFAEYLGYFFPFLSTTQTILSFPLPWGQLSISAGQVVAAASIGLLGVINYRGVGVGNAVQSAFTVLKVVALAAIPVLALLYWRVRPSFTLVIPNMHHSVGPFAVAMIAVLWACSGWDYVTFAAGEIKDPERNVPRALILGTSGLTVLYLTVNLGYVYALRIDEMQGVVRIAERAVSAMIGSDGAGFVAALVVLSAFGCNAASMIPITRVCYAMSARGLFFRTTAAVHPKYHTPHKAISITCIWAALLTLSGTYEQLYTYVVFTALLFNVAGGMAVFTLRRTRPNAPRPYRVWGYPVVPAIFVLSTGILALSTLIQRPMESTIGLGLVALGLPAYRHWNKLRTIADGRCPDQNQL